MQYFEINNKKYPFYLSYKVWKKVKNQYDVDVFKIEDEKGIEKLDDEEIRAFIGYEALKSGCIIENEDLPFSQEEYSLLINMRHYLELSNLIMNDLSSTFNYAIENFKGGGEEKKK